MSGIYISGMEMPTSCWLCHFQDCGNCVLNNHKVVDNCIMEDRRDEECPLIPVPEHGRLIDADAAKVSIAYAEETGDWSVPQMRIVLEIIDAAPTIIPASGGNENE